MENSYAGKAPGGLRLQGGANRMGKISTNLISTKKSTVQGKRKRAQRSRVTDVEPDHIRKRLRVRNDRESIVLEDVH